MIAIDFIEDLLCNGLEKPTFVIEFEPFKVGIPLENLEAPSADPILQYQTTGVRN
jgi:hypothetical protein